MAQPAKGKAPASDKFMMPDEMKPLLALSKREPIQAAVGITADGEGVILLHKKLKAKKVLAVLKATASKEKVPLAASSLRFGKAEVDTDYDPGMVRFFLNKDAPGAMRIKLLEVIKRVPYQKVELNTDTSFEDEGEDDESEAQETPTATAPPTPPEAPPMDVGTLTRALAALVQRIPQASLTADEKTRLVKLATDGNAFIKAGDLSAAGNCIAQLRQGLDAAGGAAPGGSAGTPGQSQPKGDVVKLAQAMLLWNSTRGYVAQQVKKLQETILEATSTQPNFGDIQSNITNLEAMLEVLDDSLTVKLNELRGTQDAEVKRKLSDEARGIVEGFQKYVAEDQLMNDIDTNGFLPLDIKARVTATLEAVHKTI